MEIHTMISVQLSSIVNKQLTSAEVQLPSQIITILLSRPARRHLLFPIGLVIATQSPTKIVQPQKAESAWIVQQPQRHYGVGTEMDTTSVMLVDCITKWMEPTGHLSNQRGKWTRNDGKARSVPIVPLLQLPYGEEMELENQCAMLVDFITNYTGTKGLFLWRRKTSSLEIENWAQNLGKSTTHSQLICWSPLKRCTLVMVWPVLPLPAWGPCPQQLPWPQQEWGPPIICLHIKVLFLLRLQPRPLCIRSLAEHQCTIWQPPLVHHLEECQIGGRTIPDPFERRRGT